MRYKEIGGTMAIVDIVREDYLRCRFCDGLLEYYPAEYESLSGRATVEQSPAGFVCEDCGSDQLHQPTTGNNNHD